MRRISAPLVLMLWAASAGSALAQVETIWSCKDSNGRILMTSQKEDTVGKDCRIVQQQRVTVVPAPANKATSTKSPAGFPKESTSDRLAARAKQRETIEKELNQEQSMLADARRKLTEQEAARGGDEKNYARVLERLKPYQDTVEVHEKNVEALKRELGNLSR
jgi:septal ring factor EnvC (AmiA/AmiB activator)